MPPHTLELKKGQPIIFLRNVSPDFGLCNSTRLIVRNCFSHQIEAEIAVGARSGQVVYIPRMPLIQTDSNLPFDFKRIQFPIRTAFAMKINISQGKSCF